MSSHYQDHPSSNPTEVVGDQVKFPVRSKLWRSGKLSVPELLIDEDVKTDRTLEKTFTLKKASQSVRGLKIKFSPRVSKDIFRQDSAQASPTVEKSLLQQYSYRKKASKAETQHAFQKQTSVSYERSIKEDTRNPITQAFLKLRLAKEDIQPSDENETQHPSPLRGNTKDSFQSFEIATSCDIPQAISPSSDNRDCRESMVTTTSASFSKLTSPTYFSDRDCRKSTANPFNNLKHDPVYARRSISSSRILEQHNALVDEKQDISSPMSPFSSFIDSDSIASLIDALNIPRTESTKNLSFAISEQPDEENELEYTQKFLSPTNGTRNNVMCRPDTATPKRRRNTGLVIHEAAGGFNVPRKPSSIFKAFEGSEQPTKELNSNDDGSNSNNKPISGPEKSPFFLPEGLNGTKVSFSALDDSNPVASLYDLDAIYVDIVDEET